MNSIEKLFDWILENLTDDEIEELFQLLLEYNSDKYQRFVEEKEDE